MRDLVVGDFRNWLFTSKPKLSEVAVVGGTSSDPEVSLLKEFLPNVTFHFFGIDNSNNDANYYHLDLNSTPEKTSIKFDLVLNSQVIEHVWNLSNAFDNLAQLTKDGGYLWINCPASNMPHGSPHYFSAGYTDGFIAANLRARNYEIIISKTIGSKRNYFMTHILRHWSTQAELNHPLINYHFQPGSLLGVTKKFLIDLPGRIISIFFSKKVLNSIDFATESIVLARLIKS